MEKTGPARPRLSASAAAVASNQWVENQKTDGTEGPMASADQHDIVSKPI